MAMLTNRFRDDSHIGDKLHTMGRISLFRATALL